MGDKSMLNIKAMNSNKIEPNQQQHQSEQERTPSAPFQYGLSVAIGVLTILLLSASYYFGVFGAH
jgi:hypothetical protein